VSLQGSYQHQSINRQAASRWTAARPSRNSRSTAGQGRRTMSQPCAGQNTQGQHTPEPAHDALSAINPDNQIG
jgi:hypothetical protein